MAVLWDHLTPELCREVFELTRDKERERKWTLFALMKVWLGLLQNPVLTQTRAIEACGQGHPMLPLVEASSESFFMRIQSLRPEFFRNVFTGFTKSIENKLPANFQSDLGVSAKDFPEIYAVDGSRLAKVGRTLKVARKTTKAIIPGSMEAVYDLRRGHLRELWFDPDGAKSELAMFNQILDSIAKGALLLNDRYYPKPVIWRSLGVRGIFMVSRHNATVKKRKIKTLKRTRNSRIAVDDWIVEMGGSQYNEEPVTLRWVHVRSADTDIILITNVLDPETLSVEQLLALYAQRWSIERMYLHMKEVLALNRLFNASPAAVGQQVYATAMLYNALRMSQSCMAEKLKIPPEKFSPDKLFAQLIEKLVHRTWMGVGSENTITAYKIRPTRKEITNLDRNLCCHPSLMLSLQGVFVEKRRGEKKCRRFCKGRKTWTTYRKIPGAKKYLRN